ncbi:MAG: hypothetical protein CMJ46_13435 [Planctomyces sp.]|nr:hypothetical protein [Planctomyces sp.]
MAVILTIRDETMTGDVYNEVPLEFPSEQVTVRELIRSRVYEEVQTFNRQQDNELFNGLVQPTDTEQILNGRKTSYKLKKRRQLDWKEQYEKATEAFARNGFLILIDNRQSESLDEVVTLGADTNVSFVKLTLLVGG